MKVISKQRNSRMCAICGLDNDYGVQAPFYNMEDGSVMTLFQYKYHHQSYPGRVHGGLITAMLDEVGLRALWAAHGVEDDFGVTMSLESKFRQPVPYETKLIAQGTILTDSRKFFTIDTKLMDLRGNLLANGIVKYIKLPVELISEGATIHEEMPYLVEDGVTEINFEN